MLFSIYWEFEKSEYTKIELKYHSFKENQNFWWKLIFEKKFRTQKLEKSVFQDMWNLMKFLKKIEKFRISPQGGRARFGIDPNIFFWRLGCLCGQNESYTSLVRPFLMIFYFREVRPFFTDFMEIAFSMIFKIMTSQREKVTVKGNDVFANCIF